MQWFRNHYRGDEYLDPSAVARAEAETDCHLSVISRGYSRLAAAGWALRALRANPFSAQCWRGLAAVLAPTAIRRMIRRLSGRDGAWEQHCHTPSNRPDPIL